MKRIAFRGISLLEAQSVIATQVYERNERRDFQNGIQARSTFGPGIYLINDVELAAQYAFCHTEVEEGERGAVLKQTIQIEKPYIINQHSTEKNLKQKALDWKLNDERCSSLHSDKNSPKIDKNEMGPIVKEYLLHHGYDGIVYHVDDEIIYYVCYFQERQVENITIDFIFNIEDLKKMSVLEIRENFKKSMKHNVN